MCRATLPDIFPVDPGPTAAEEEGGSGARGVCVCARACLRVWARVYGSDYLPTAAPSSHLTVPMADWLIRPASGWAAGL